MGELIYLLGGFVTDLQCVVYISKSGEALVSHASQ